MSAVSASELQQRLSEQLQALSQVGETLTLRLLELEERLGGLEQQLETLQLGGLDQEDRVEATRDLLAATEERIARLEELLSDPAGGAAATLRSVPLRRPVQALPHNEGSRDGEPEAELDPFPEEEEQPFMDELSA